MKKIILKQHVGYWLNRLTTCTHQGFEKKLARHGISVAQWCILVSLYDESACSVGELSTYIEVDKGSISRVVERLVQSGLIIHGTGINRRSGKLILTDEGKALVPQLIAQATANEKEFFGHLSFEELEQFQTLLHKIMINIPSIHTDGWLKKGQ
ncbi:MAG: MarR family transcriptional regulator [Alphaproteobacteria bacterium]|nr:MarR family transcriptional regulator [Alphaproteobacteria bacterium]